jgi:bacteriorhodopsin
MLIVLPLAAKVKMSRAIQFIVAGLGMIWTSWAAQFAETGGIVHGTTATPFWAWYFISWAFYAWIVVIVVKTVRDGNQGLPAKARKVMNGVLGLLLVSWTAYAVAIVLPQVWWSSSSGVARQFIFTTADIVSKAVYGVLLGWVATIRSSSETDYQETFPDDLAVLTPTSGGVPEASQRKTEASDTH